MFVSPSHLSFVLFFQRHALDSLVAEYDEQGIHTRMGKTGGEALGEDAEALLLPQFEQDLRHASAFSLDLDARATYIERIGHNRRCKGRQRASDALDAEQWQRSERRCNETNARSIRADERVSLTENRFEFEHLPLIKVIRRPPDRAGQAE